MSATSIHVDSQPEIHLCLIPIPLEFASPGPKDSTQASRSSP